MRISIKIKFSIFLAILLLFTVLLLSLFVLKGIERDQQAQVEHYLAQQADTANIYFLQTILAEPNKAPEDFLSSKGEGFAQELENIVGQVIVLYNNQGEIISESLPSSEREGFKITLKYALENKTAYQVEDESLYYMAPLRVGNKQVGVVQFYYSLSENHEFYNYIRKLFIYIGAGVFILSFFLAYFYFNSYADKIIKLEKMTYKISKGDFDVRIIKSRDEIGMLSEGIHLMSNRIMTTIQDIEEEKEKLKLAVDQLTRLEKQQKEFIGNVTHEFKTPLTSIKAYLDLLEMYPEDKELPDTAIITIKNETERLYDMVGKVLQLSALEKYDFESIKEKVEVKSAIEQVLSSLKGKMDKFGIHLEEELVNAIVEVDKDRFIIVLMNLMDNAIKYNKDTGSIIVRNYIKEHQVVIEIADTGIGIPEELMDKIFQPFYTVDQARSREFGGTGLGLSLAKNYIEVLGGAISLVETGNEGSCFRIVLPIYNQLD